MIMLSSSQKTSLNCLCTLILKTFAFNSLIEAQTISKSMKTFALFVYHYTFFYSFCKYYFFKKYHYGSLYIDFI
ncbi:hypothetical protein CN491_12090 [Bacillus cereus]|uniref:Uncharacterized protein n=1 Tax=Bacillus cereus TaxID=1396 RepID=A0A2A8LNZ4_BACCE|nr:hypothetical protein CN491_12090 [Bacillus cereus]PFP72516.1 hypothetical protein COJ95_22840 [Bacillus cereus]